MGCHTWVAKKASVLKEEEKKKLIEEVLKGVKFSYSYKSDKDYVETMKPYYEDVIKKHDKKVKEGKADSKMVKLINSWRKFLKEEELIKEYHKLQKQKQKMIDVLSKFDDEAFSKAIKSLSYPEKVKYNKEIYVHIDFDYPFRVVTGYSTKIISTKEALLDYLKTSGETVRYYDTSSGKFVEGYTEELENRINVYFNIHGEDNLIFHFG